MTENEAIKHLQSYAEFVDNMIKYCKDFEPKADITGYLEKKAVFAMEISALTEVQQYRKIGTVEECREAREKQKPKKPETIERDFDYYKCPVCGEYIWATDNINSHKYCLNCGQKIEMEESE